MERLSFKRFNEEYFPVSVINNAGIGEVYLFDELDDIFDFLELIPDNRIWTLYEYDGSELLLPGNNKSSNSIGYVVTLYPWEESYMYVAWDKIIE